MDMIFGIYGQLGGEIPSWPRETIKMEGAEMGMNGADPELLDWWGFSSVFLRGVNLGFYGSAIW